MPFFGTRIFNLHTKRTFMNTGRNTRGSNEEVVTSEIGQVGTQFDGFAHQSHGDSLYNCFKTSEVGDPRRVHQARACRTPVEHVRARRADRRGRAARGVEMLGRHVRDHAGGPGAGARAQGDMKLLPGDAVNPSTPAGGKLWGKDNARYVKSDARPGQSRPPEWVAKQDPHAGRRRQLAGGGLAQSGLRTLACRDTRSSSWCTGSTCSENMKLDELARRKSTSSR
jgi:hypothetical protein